MSTIDMTPRAVEARLVTLSISSSLSLEAPARVDMSPAAIEARLQEWAELTVLCLELSGSRVERSSGR